MPLISRSGAGAHALAGHGDQAVAFEAAEVVAEFGGSRAEGPGAGQSGQFDRLRRVLRPQRNGIERLVVSGIAPSHTILNMVESSSIRQPAGAAPDQSMQ